MLLISFPPSIVSAQHRPVIVPDLAFTFKRAISRIAQGLGRGEFLIRMAAISFAQSGVRREPAGRSPIDTHEPPQTVESA
jgi:hypothetical protein